MESSTSVHVHIEGRVQGVWYRGWTIEQARRRHLSGWVRNRTDGTVEAVFSGPAAQVAEMVAACRRGPPGAVVTDLRTEPAPEPEAGAFRQLPTV